MSQPETASPPLEAPIVAVVLFEDRAQVTRRATLELEPGAHRLVVRPITPLLADRTLQLDGPEAVRLDEARVRRTWRIGLDEDRPDEAELKRRRQQLQDQITLRREALAGVERRRQMLARATTLLVDDLNRQLPRARELESRWREELEQLWEALGETDLRWLEGRHELADLDRRLEELEQEGQASIPPAPTLDAQLELELEVLESGAHQVELEYTVPCALWRPIHRATLGGGDVTFECEAALWQATGEDWPEVDLRFSTARPTQRSEPPRLEDDLLRAQRRRERKVAVSLRETEVASTGEGMARRARGLPGVDDGGETRLLQGSVRTSVASDGRMRRVPISSFTAAADLDRICCPELSTLVHLRSHQTNEGAQPLLAGPVTLLRDSGYVGQTTIPFVAPGERFVLGWGSDDGLRLRREARRQREQARISGRQKLTTTVELSLSNLSARPAAFTVTERVPVSEIDKVDVELDRDQTSPPAKPDDQGMLSWSVELPGHGTKTLKLRYTLLATGSVEGL